MAKGNRKKRSNSEVKDNSELSVKKAKTTPSNSSSGKDDNGSSAERSSTKTGKALIVTLRAAHPLSRREGKRTDYLIDYFILKVITPDWPGVSSINNIVIL